MIEKVYRAIVELNGGKITFEGSREFVEAQVARWAQLDPSKQLALMDTASTGIGEIRAGITERDLINQKHPSGHLETVAVLAFALRETGIEEFSARDVRQAYLRAGVRPPKVVEQALRDAKNRVGYIEPASRRGLYRLSQHGDTTVRFDLPRS